MRPRQFIPPAFVAMLLGSGLLALWIDPGVYLFALIGGSYILANLIASAWAAGRKGWQYLPTIPLAYATMHISYGLGFLIGLLRFVNRWKDKAGQVPSLVQSST